MVAEYILSMNMAIVGYFVILFPVLCVLIGAVGGFMHLKSWKTTAVTVLFFFLFFLCYSFIVSPDNVLSGPYVYLIYYGALTFGASQLILSVKKRRRG